MPEVIPDLQFVGLSNNGKKFISPHLRMGMSIYPIVLKSELKFAGNRSRSGAIKLNFEPDTQVSMISFDWDKQMGQAAGVWSATLKEKRSASGELRANILDQDIRDGDWCDVSVVRNSESIPLCRGVVETVREQRSSAGGATVITHLMTGKDHGSFFEYPITWSHLWARTINQLAAGLFTDRVNGLVGGRPDQLFEALIKGTFEGAKTEGRAAGQWRIPPSLSDVIGPENKVLSDILKLVMFNAQEGIDGLRGAYYNETQLWTVGEQNLHETLSQWVHPLLNEYWYDLLPPKRFMPPHSLNAYLSFQEPQFDAGSEFPPASDTPQVFQPGEPQDITSDSEEFGTIAALIRERPFPTNENGIDSMWYKLPTWVIPTWMIQNQDLGRSGHERYTLFDLIGDYSLGSSDEQAATQFPAWWREGIENWGLRAYHQTTRHYAQPTGPNNANGPAQWIEERGRWLEILRDWYGPNPYLRQGSITIKTMLPEIRIGHRILLDDGSGADNREQFYVEGVRLGWRAPTQSAGATGTTTLTVTRGFRGSDQQLQDAVGDMPTLFERRF